MALRRGSGSHALRSAWIACIACAAALAAPGRAESPALDLTLTPREYLELGMPAVDRPWIGTDYQAAVRVLAGLGPDQLPHSGSVNSGSVMDRLTNPVNLAYYQNTNVPLEQRFPPFVVMLQSCGMLYKTYAEHVLRNPYREIDFARLTEFMVETMIVAQSLVDEFLPTLDPKDPSYSVRMGGVAQMRDGKLQMIQGTLLLLEESSQLGPSARLMLARTLARHWSALEPSIPPLSRTEFLTTLKRLALAEKDPAVKQMLAPFANVSPDAPPPPAPTPIQPRETTDLTPVRRRATGPARHPSLAVTPRSARGYNSPALRT